MGAWPASVAVPVEVQDVRGVGGEDEPGAPAVGGELLDAGELAGLSGVLCGWYFAGTFSVFAG